MRGFSKLKGRGPVPKPKGLPPRHPIALSRTHPFVTLLLSDLNGPSRRQRLVLRNPPFPDWLRSYAALIGPGFDLVVGAMGRARLGSRTRIQSIVVYPAQHEMPEMAYVYVEERAAGDRATRDAAPVHIVRCARLPTIVRFVEVSVSAGLPGFKPALKLA
jgi:hypothetical protein